MDEEVVIGSRQSGPVVALVADLLFAARIRGTAEQVGTTAVTVRSPDELLRVARADPPRLILIQLDARSGDFAGAIRAVKADPALAGVTVIGFASHVDEASIALARQAGADRVMARSAFVRELATLLAPGA